MTHFTVRSVVLFVGIIFAGIAQGQTPQLVEGGPVHEAFVTPVTESIALEAIETQPPPPITERIPPKPGPDIEWVHGYWAWAPDRKDFLWVSGVWRRPPPGMQWIYGIWKHYDEGWVRIQGFWSREPVDSLSTIDIAPPDQIDEAVSPAPGNGVFWISGYWEYSTETRDYAWRSGRWVVLDPNLILVPAHYVWRPGGYVFVSSYWDWPIEQRGRAYATAYIPPSARAQVIYEPVYIEPTIIVHNLFFYYPDYSYFFYHHHYYHPVFWNEFGYAPPWWRWNTWWGLRWHDHWAVWWWYCHPGYPHPAWITVELANRIPPPPRVLITKIKIVSAPAIVTVKGVVPPHRLLQATTQNKLSVSKGAHAPILPADPKRVEKIKDNAKTEELGANRPATRPLMPAGRQVAHTQQTEIEKQAAPAKPTTTPTTRSPRQIESPGATLPSQPRTNEPQRIRVNEKIEPRPPIKSAAPTRTQPDQIRPTEREKHETTPTVRPPIKKPSEPIVTPQNEPRLQEKETREPSTEVRPPIKKSVAPALESRGVPVPRQREISEGYRLVEPPPKPSSRGFERTAPALREIPRGSFEDTPSQRAAPAPAPSPAEPRLDDRERSRGK